VADGVGGLANGDLASRLAMQLLNNSLADRKHKHIPLRERILSGLEEADAKISKKCAGGATTFVAAQLKEDTVRSYHAGDSAMLIIGRGGDLKYQTISHSPVGYAVESGLLSENEAFSHHDRHLVSNLVGTQDLRVEIGPEIRLTERDIVVLGSDGLFDNLTINEISRITRSGPIPAASNQLAKTVVKRMKQSGVFPSKPDDVTFIMYRPYRS
jgi:serine/threonine protein phosphatase PrpC